MNTRPLHVLCLLIITHEVTNHVVFSSHNQTNLNPGWPFISRFGLWFEQSSGFWRGCKIPGSGAGGIVNDSESSLKASVREKCTFWVGDLNPRTWDKAKGEFEHQESL